MSAKQYWTKRQAVSELNERGIPATPSTFDKARMYGTGPEPVARFGNHYLYEPETVLAWAQKLLTPVVVDAKTPTAA